MANSQQSNNKQAEDRYISFVGLGCDGNADLLIEMLDKHLNAADGESKWQRYFAQKRQQQTQFKHDNLNFIGHQTNTLYEYFNSCEDQQAISLLYKIEQQCC